ncbi:MAG: helix-turn-helix domain-containing protein [Arsenophonus sp.]|nr:helix-turn-helix domain-containing protein [Arsenophonus sp.]MDR5610420.1 helix-turn-helix domain-containing protein [Arsenophonus sp.]
MVHIEKLREEFSQRLAQACNNAGLNERGRGAAIMKALGVSSKAVSKWFNGEALPRQDKIDALAKFLKCDVVWLQHGKNFDSKSDEPYHRLTKTEEILLEMFNELPQKEKDSFMKAINTRKNELDQLYEEMKAVKERKGKRAS